MPELRRLRDGTTVELRPVEHDDAELIRRAFEELSPRSRYERFLAPVPRLPKHWLDSLVDVDHRDREALAAVDPQTGEGLAVARYVRLEDDPAEAEFAVTVADAWQGRGLGRLIMEELVQAARANDLERLSGDILAGNDPMIGLSRSLGRGATVTQPRDGRVHAVIQL
jgi:GNAT superfamily N-acetyltransferase